MLDESILKQYISECKSFWNITDFEKEIVNWKFNANLDKDIQSIVIGHPPTSHKGTSIGDILPYTRLPELLKLKYPKIKVYIPEWFSSVFQYNPYVDGISNDVCRWGSLGTWGTTVQRTSNVWGLQTFEFRPIIYRKLEYKDSNYCIISANSKTGGGFKNIPMIEEIVKSLKETGLTVIQLGTSKEKLIRNVDQYRFNLGFTDLIELMHSAKFYIGAQNSLYHIARAMGIRVIGILPENVNPYFVVLPFLTQVNDLEIEMLSNQEIKRAHTWCHKMRNIGIDPLESHHIGWLYPDVPHLTLNFEQATHRCPSANPDNIKKALNFEIYPFGDPRLYDFKYHIERWN